MGHHLVARVPGEQELWINGGYFVFEREFFDCMRPGEDLVEEPFERLIRAGQLIAHRYAGFWAPMDGLKDKQTLDSLHEAGRDPWRVWRGGAGPGTEG